MIGTLPLTLAYRHGYSDGMAGRPMDAMANGLTASEAPDYRRGWMQGDDTRHPSPAYRHSWPVDMGA